VEKLLAVARNSWQLVETGSAWPSIPISPTTRHAIPGAKN